MKQILILLFICLAFTSCNPKVTTSVLSSYSSLSGNEEVMVYAVGENAPASAEELGEIKIGDTGFTTNCDYELVINTAKHETRKVGGNILKLTDYKPPSALGSTCHRIEAKMMRVDDLEKLSREEYEGEEISDEPFAKLHIYRYPGTGSLVGYNLYLGEDSLLCRVKNNFKTIVEISQEGEYMIWAKTETLDEVKITLEHGRSYYLKCGINMGAFVGRPELQLMGSRFGSAEFEAFDAKND